MRRFQIRQERIVALLRAIRIVRHGALIRTGPIARRADLLRIFGIAHRYGRVVDVFQLVAYSHRIFEIIGLDNNEERNCRILRVIFRPPNLVSLVAVPVRTGIVHYGIIRNILCVKGIYLHAPAIAACRPDRERFPIWNHDLGHVDIGEFIPFTEVCVPLVVGLELLGCLGFRCCAPVHGIGPAIAVRRVGGYR